MASKKGRKNSEEDSTTGDHRGGIPLAFGSSSYPFAVKLLVDATLALIGRLEVFTGFLLRPLRVVLGGESPDCIR